MAYPTGSIPITGLLGTTSSTDSYPITTDELNLGGFRSVYTIADRDNIPLPRRKFGMMVVTQDTNPPSVYMLCNIAMGGTSDNLSDNANWVKDTSTSPGVVNVKDYGVLGDGVTDDTVAIQAIINSGAKVLYFPAGTYIHQDLYVASNQMWYGDGWAYSILSWAQVNRVPNIRGYTSTTGISNVVFEDLAFRGNLNAQTTIANGGQWSWGFWFRTGAISNVRWTRCKIYEWGEQGTVLGTFGGGAMAIGGTTTEGITIEDCEIGNNANVPGVYFSAYIQDEGTAYKNLTITGTRFFQTNTHVVQNMVYIVGYNNRMFENVKFEGNTFDINVPYDTSLEINFARNVTINDNVWNLYGNGISEGILLRSSIENLTIDGNIFNNHGTNTETRAAIASVNFADSFLQKNLTITNNVLKDWPGYLINIATISQNVNISGNLFVGEVLTPQVGVSVGNSNQITIANNRFSNIGIPISLGGNIGVDQLEIVDNTFTDCGAQDNALISTPVSNVPVTNVKVISNKVYAPKSIVRTFWAVSGTSSQGNRLIDNFLPDGFPLYNLSYPQFIERRVAPYDTDGTAVARLTYAFDQGQIALVPFSNSINENDPYVQKSSAVFGANLDAYAPICEPGDGIIVTPTADIQGAHIYGYVPSANKVRIAIHNPRNAALTIPPARWYVTIIRRPPFATTGNILGIGTDQRGDIVGHLLDGTFTVNGTEIIIGTSSSISTK